MIRVNTAKDRAKSRPLRPGAPVALAIMDPDNAYRYIQIRGRVRRAVEQGAHAHIDSLAKKYLGKEPILSANRARFGSCTRSSRSRYPEWTERTAGRNDHPRLA